MEDEEYDDFYSSDDDLSSSPEVSSCQSSESDLPCKRRRLAEKFFKEYDGFPKNNLAEHDSYEDLVRGGSKTNIFEEIDSLSTLGEKANGYSRKKKLQELEQERNFEERILLVSSGTAGSGENSNRVNDYNESPSLKSCPKSPEIGLPLPGPSSSQFEIEEVMVFRKPSLRRRPRCSRNHSRNNRSPLPQTAMSAVPLSARTPSLSPIRVCRARATQREEPESRGRTALHLAVEMGLTDVVEVLIDAGADVNALDEFGHCPLQVAGKRRLFSVVRRLRSAGAHCRDDELSSRRSY